MRSWWKAWKYLRAIKAGIFHSDYFFYTHDCHHFWMFSWHSKKNLSVTFQWPLFSSFCFIFLKKTETLWSSCVKEIIWMKNQQLNLVFLNFHSDFFFTHDRHHFWIFLCHSKKPFSDLYFLYVFHFFFLNGDGHLYKVTQNSCKWGCFIIYLPPALLRKQASVTTQIPPSVVLAMNYLNEPGSQAQRNILKSSGDNAIWFV